MTCTIVARKLQLIMASSRALKIYETDSGKRPFNEWLDDLKDPMTRARVRARLDRVATGNFGDAKSVGDGVFELRFTVGAGIRVYYGLDGDTLVVLLLGGDKSSQDKDIVRAKQFWVDYKGAKND
jgi:putative addiction module killer protein